MTRKKRNNLRTLLTIFFILLIITGLLWGTNDNSSDRLPADSADAASLQVVVVPESLPSQLIEYEGFTVSFNPRAHQPNYVAWELNADKASSDIADRKAHDFAQDFSVEGCATLQDYKNSGFSRGHMAPAADMKWSDKAMLNCFYLTNMTPQKSELNNGAWKSVEDKCRQWAERDSSIIIICGPVLSDEITRTIGASRIPVPERFFKVILAPYADPPRAIGFIMNNGYVEGGMQAAAVSVDEVERITGFDFFSSLPDEIEAEIESQCNFPLWSKIRNK